MSVTENTSPAALRAAARDGEAGSRWSVRWAWFGGADASVLRYVPSELSFLSSLGTTIVALAFLSGFVVSVAVSSWWNTPLYRVLWVGAAWTVLFALIERLVQKSFSTKWLWNAVIIIPRAALSVAMALVFAVPMSQLIFSKSIDAAADQHDRGRDTRRDGRGHLVLSSRGSRARPRRSRRCGRTRRRSRRRSASTRSRAGARRTRRRAPTRTRPAAETGATSTRARPRPPARSSPRVRAQDIVTIGKLRQSARALARRREQGDQHAHELDRRQPGHARPGRGAPARREGPPRGRHLRALPARLLLLPRPRSADDEGDAPDQHRRRVREGRRRAPRARRGARAPDPGGGARAPAAHQRRGAGGGGGRPGRDRRRPRAPDPDRERQARSSPPRRHQAAPRPGG